jgi:LuxR family maltose regulon positive regulatory protein
LARAYAASAQHRPDEAVAILRPLQQDLESAHNRHFALRVEMLGAAMLFRAKQSAEALAMFDQVVAAFAEAGIHRSILDEAREIGPMLPAFQESGLAARRSLTFPAFMTALLAAWTSPGGPESRPTQNVANAAALSRRESDILRLIGEGFSNKEIARELAIAPETVKTHLKHVFAKLNVEKRAQAVSRAQVLGLANTSRD